MPDTLIASQRSLFRVPEEVAYLNCAYMSPQLEAVTQAGQEAARLKEQPWQIGEQAWFGRVEDARERFARAGEARMSHRCGSPVHARSGDQIP